MFLSKPILIGVGWEFIGNLFFFKKKISAADVVCLEEASVLFFIYRIYLFQGQQRYKKWVPGERHTKLLC